VGAPAQELIAEARRGAPRKALLTRGEAPASRGSRAGAHCGGRNDARVHEGQAGGRRVSAYVCNFHWKRGASVCPIAIRQPQDSSADTLKNRPYVDGSKTGQKGACDQDSHSYPSRPIGSLQGRPVVGFASCVVRT